MNNKIYCKMFIPPVIVLLFFILNSYGWAANSKRPYDHIVITNDGEFQNNHISNFPNVGGGYSPTWDSLDARPLPSWYDKSKVGVFFHWGVFSVPAFGNEWFWYQWKGAKDAKTIKFMEENYSPRFTYQDFAKELTAEFYDPYRWVDILKKAGAKYIVFSSKHHEGYTLWPSKYSFGWNAGDVGPNRDLLGELADAVRNSSDIRFGIYHSWFEWFNPLYLADKQSGFTERDFVEFKAMPELKELVTKYKPEVIWSDGDWEAQDEYWQSKDFLAWLYNSSPVKDTVVVNDRWGNGTPCHHGGFFTCQDHYTPGKVLPYKWENAMTVDKSSWGFRRNAALEDFRTPQELIYELVSTVSCGGNFLINVGPTKYGMIAPILEERLNQIGQWLEVNGDAIYESTPWKVAQNDSTTKGVWYTAKPEAKNIYSIILEEGWPEESDDDMDDKPKIVLGSVDSKVVKIKSIKMIGSPCKKSLTWIPCEGTVCKTGIQVTLPSIRPTQTQWGWTLIIHYN